jgi:rubrerythrin
MKQNSSTSRGRNQSPSDGRSRGHSARLNSTWLKEFLVEMHAVEEGGTQLYEKALDELQHEKYRSQLETFLQQTQRHVQLCEELMEAASMSRDSSSPGAEAAEHKAEGLISAVVPEHLNDVNNFENLVLAETKDHWNWTMLSSIMDQIPDADLKKAVKGAVREVAKQEVDHLQKMQRALTDVATELARLAGPDEQSEQEAEEEEEGEEYDA